MCNHFNHNNIRLPILYIGRVREKKFRIFKYIFFMHRQFIIYFCCCCFFIQIHIHIFNSIHMPERPIIWISHVSFPIFSPFSSIYTYFFNRQKTENFLHGWNERIEYVSMYCYRFFFVQEDDLICSNNYLSIFPLSDEKKLKILKIIIINIRSIFIYQLLYSIFG